VSPTNLSRIPRQNVRQYNLRASLFTVVRHSVPICVNFRARRPNVLWFFGIVGKIPSSICINLETSIELDFSKTQSRIRRCWTVSDQSASQFFRLQAYLSLCRIPSHRSFGDERVCGQTSQLSELPIERYTRPMEIAILFVL
jgi:hypothetical protein